MRWQLAKRDRLTMVVDQVYQLDNQLTSYTVHERTRDIP